MATTLNEGLNSSYANGSSHRGHLENGVSVNQFHNNTEVVVPQKSTSEEEETPEIDITINNVVCSFSVRCHLNLRQIALNGANVEFRRENGMVTMKIRNPLCTASMWSSGKISCTGATSEAAAKVAARKFARILQKLGYKVRFSNYRVVNVLGTCIMPFGIKLGPFSEENRKTASYEPELHPGVTYKIKETKATLKVFSTGSITVTAPSVSIVEEAIHHIYSKVSAFRKVRTKEEQMLALKQKNKSRETNKRKCVETFEQEEDYLDDLEEEEDELGEEEEEEELEDDDYESDQSAL